MKGAYPTTPVVHSYHVQVFTTNTRPENSFFPVKYSYLKRKKIYNLFLTKPYFSLRKLDKPRIVLTKSTIQGFGFLLDIPTTDIKKSGRRAEVYFSLASPYVRKRQ